MESSFFPQTIGVSTIWNPCRNIYSKKPMKSRVSAILVRLPAGEKIQRISQYDAIDEGATDMVRAPKTVYKDSWFDLVATNHLSHNVQKVTGVSTWKRGYEGLVEAVTGAYRSFGPTMQRNLIVARSIPRLPKANP